jgi:SOS response regulatory protein OraA/RecX
MDADSCKLLLKKAGTLLARRAYSRGELREKLRKTAQAAEVESVLDRLEKLNLLNDLDYAYNFALCRVRQEGWGPAKLRESLLRRAVAQETVEAALKRVFDEVDPRSALADHVRKRFGKSGLPSDIPGVRRLILQLRRRGFDDDTIRGALKTIVPAALLERLETGE